jgi:hypothetical protein
MKVELKPQTLLSIYLTSVPIIHLAEIKTLFLKVLDELVTTEALSNDLMKVAQSKHILKVSETFAVK